MDDNWSEELLTESLKHHKIRNVAQKVSKLDPKHDQITKEILRQFCPQPVTEKPRNINPVETETSIPISVSTEKFEESNKTTESLISNHTFPPISSHNLSKINGARGLRLKFEDVIDATEHADGTERKIVACESYGKKFYQSKQTKALQILNQEKNVALVFIRLNVG